MAAASKASIATPLQLALGQTFGSDVAGEVEAPTALMPNISSCSCRLPDQRPRMLDMFAGAGGTGWGFVKAGFQVVGVVECNKHAAATYSRNIGFKVEPQDIRALNPRQYRKSLGLNRGELEVLVGCSPCQGFSGLRNDKGAGDERNDLVLIYLNFIREFLPRFVLFENVSGIRTRHGLEIYNAFCAGLCECGYYVCEKLLDAADYGVPQHRERVLVVAGRAGEVPVFPEATHAAPDSPEVKNGLKQRWRTVRDAIFDFPKVGSGQSAEGEFIPEANRRAFPNHIAPQTGAKVLEFLQLVPKDGGSRMDVDQSFWLPCHLKKDKEGDVYRGHRDVYGRLAWERPAGTMTTGCTNPSKGRFTHPDQDRCITPREAAALQSFPLDFVFAGQSLSTQIGNAVPPLLAEAVAISLHTQTKLPAPPLLKVEHWATELGSGSLW